MDYLTMNEDFYITIVYNKIDDGLYLTIYYLAKEKRFLFHNCHTTGKNIEFNPTQGNTCMEYIYRNIP